MTTVQPGKPKSQSDAELDLFLPSNSHPISRNNQAMKARSTFRVFVALPVLCSVADAQQIVVKDKPGLGEWQVSISQKFSPGTFKHSSSFKTLAEAKADAQRRIAQNPNQGNDWDIHTVLIEGEDAKPKKAEPDEKDKEKQGGDLLKRLRAARELERPPLGPGTLDPVLAQVIEEYKKAVEDAYRRIKKFEETLLDGTQEMQEQRFREINKLVDQYNRQVNEFRAVMGPTVPLGFKPMPHFETPTAARAQTRDESAPDEETPRPPAQKFKLYTAQNVGGYTLAGIFDSVDAAKAAGDRFLSENPSPTWTRQYVITDGRDPRTKIGDRPSLSDIRPAVVADRATR